MSIGLIAINLHFTTPISNGSIVKAHQHSSGCQKHSEAHIGRSVAGDSTTIHLAVDSFGLSMMFKITGGEVDNCKVAPEFFAALPPSE